MRPNPDKKLLPNNTPFKDSSFSERFFRNLLVSQGIPQGTENYTYAINSGISYGPMEYNSTGDPVGPHGWSDNYRGNQISIQLSLSQNLALLINTYLCASQTNGGLNDPANQLFDQTYGTRYSLKAWGNGTQKLENWTAVPVWGAPYEPQYRLVIPWIILDWITCTILLFAAFASVWLRMRTVCPDVFGYVSSMTRDNPHIPVPKGGSTMSGTERARAMKNVRVKIGEVERGDGSPGHIGLALEHPEIPLDRLRRKGEYM